MNAHHNSDCMQRFFSILIIILLPGFVTAQNLLSNLPSSKVFFENFHGLSNDNDHNYIEGEGYNIAIVTFHLEPTESNYKKAAKKTFHKYVVLKQKMNGDPLENFVIENNDPQQGIPVIRKAFLIRGENNTITVISFARFIRMDSNFVNNAVAMIIYNGVYDSVFMHVRPSSLDFLGHNIALGNTCHWMGPDNMQCTHYGQMNWSVYKTMADAEEYKQIQIDANKAKKLTKVISEEKVPVIFEGVETIADRIVFKVKLPKMVTGGSNALIVYYVAAEVHGKFVHCVMSFYEDEAPQGKLAPFIAEVMKLKQ